MNERRKTFGVDPGPTDDLGAGDFQPRPIARPDPEAARRVAEVDGYTSGATTRAPGDTQHRYRTGRTAQLNLKVTPENRARFAAMAAAAGVSMNDLFDAWLDAQRKLKDAIEDGSLRFAPSAEGDPAYERVRKNLDDE